MVVKIFPTIILLLLGGELSRLEAKAILVNNTTRNGSFESGSGTIPADWVPLPMAGPSQISRATATANTALVHSGSFSLVIGKSPDGVATQGAALNSGYSIGSGDSFDLSFWHNGAFNWDTGDQINFQLFYTSDNTINGTITPFFSDTVSPMVPGTGSTWQQFSLSGIAGTPEIVGKTLFVSFAAGAGVSSNEFARIDEVSLNVVPEPGAYLLAGAGAGWFLLLSRRHRRA